MKKFISNHILLLMTLLVVCILGCSPAYAQSRHRSNKSKVHKVSNVAKADKAKSTNNNVDTTNITEYHDAAMFLAPRGKVKSIDYGTKGVVYFFPNGKINISKSTYLNKYKTCLFTRNSKGFPISMKTDSSLIEYTYDEEGDLHSRHVVNADKTESTEIFNYIGGFNKEMTYNYHGKSGHTTTNCDFTKFDYKNNLIAYGSKGTSHQETDVWRDYATAGDVIGTVNYDTRIVTTGNWSEKRSIEYYYDGYDYTKNAKPTDITIDELFRYPFLIKPEVSKKRKEIKKNLKNLNIPYEEGDELGHIYKGVPSRSKSIIVPVSNKTFFGFPIDKMIMRVPTHKNWQYNQYYVNIDINCNEDEKEKALEILDFVGDILDKDTTNFRSKNITYTDFSTIEAEKPFLFKTEKIIDGKPDFFYQDISIILQYLKYEGKYYIRLQRDWLDTDLF